MATVTTTAVEIVILGCLLMRVLATSEEPGVTDGVRVNSSDQDGQNATVTAESEGSPPRTHHAALRYVVANFKFRHVQTPFIVAAWILFVTLAKIGNKSNLSCRPVSLFL